MTEPQKSKLGRKPSLVDMDTLPDAGDLLITALRERCRGRNPDDVRQELAQKGMECESATFRSWLTGRRKPRGLNRTLLEAALRGEMASVPAATDNDLREIQDLLRGSDLRKLHSRLKKTGFRIAFETLRSYAKGTRVPDKSVQPLLRGALRRVQPSSARRTRQEEREDRLAAILQLALELHEDEVEQVAWYRLMCLMDDPERWPDVHPALAENEVFVRMSRNLRRVITRMVNDSRQKDATRRRGRQHGAAAQAVETLKKELGSAQLDDLPGRSV